MKVETDLTRSRTKSFQGLTTKKSQEMKLLMDASASEEREILKAAGLDFNIKEVETRISMNVTREKHEADLGRKVFTESEIKSTCLKYNLRFLESKNYKGTIEPDLGAVILKFFKDNNITGGNYVAENSLYIMAPMNAFNLTENREPKKIDPVLFYRIYTPDGPMYALIHKWGKDFTVFRRIMGLARETSWSWNWFKTCVCFVVFCLIGFAYGINPFSWWALLSNVVLSLICCGIETLWHIDNWESAHSWNWYRNGFNRTSWNSTTYNK
jgi:hypothetical protein